MGQGNINFLYHQSSIAEQINFNNSHENFLQNMRMIGQIQIIFLVKRQSEIMCIFSTPLM